MQLSGVELKVQPVLIENAAPAEGIVRTALELGADLIVVGSHGRGAVQRFVLGSVAAKVVRQSSIPVLVVPAAP